MMATIIGFFIYVNNTFIEIQIETSQKRNFDKHRFLDFLVWELLKTFKWRLTKWNTRNIAGVNIAIIAAMKNDIKNDDFYFTRVTQHQLEFKKTNTKRKAFWQKFILFA